MIYNVNQINTRRYNTFVSKFTHIEYDAKYCSCNTKSKACNNDIFATTRAQRLFDVTWYKLNHECIKMGMEVTMAMNIRSHKKEMAMNVLLYVDSTVYFL